MLICSHAALCSSVDALTCIAAVAWLSAVRAINPRFAAAESTARAFSVAAVVTFTSNFFFWFQTGYFDHAAVEKPLLHTWSLAV